MPTKAPARADVPPNIAKSSAVNDTFFRRILVIAAVRLLRKIRPYKGVLLVSKRLCVKYGPAIQLSEASTMRFISQNTSIPVPKVFCAFTHRGCTYIVMERIKGDMAGRGWAKRSAESKTKILSQLKLMIQEMRSIPPNPNQEIANINGEPLCDGRVPSTSVTSMTFGPFDSIQEFHKHLRRGVEHHPNFPPKLKELFTWHESQWPLVFTHGDLSSLNILVQGDKINAIIDWETAGWYPSYWEYTTASYVNPQNYFWRDEIDKFLDPMPKELAMEEIRREYFGDF